MAIASAVQVLITAQFREAFRPLNALEIASLHQVFASELPQFEQISPAGPMPFRLGHLDGSEPMDYAIPTMSRLSLGSGDRRRIILIQQDRFSYGWQRVAGLREQDDYPGFDALLADFDSALLQFTNWTHELLGLSLEPNVAEIAYTNAIPTETADGVKLRLSDIYSFMNPSITPAVINGYNYTWNEKLNNLEGILVVAAVGPVRMPSGEHATTLALTSTFKVDEVQGLSSGLLAARDRSGQTFRRVLVGKGV